MNGANGSGGAARFRLPGSLTPVREARIVLRSRLRWRAMAEMDQDQPRFWRAAASTSSSQVSMGRDPSVLALRGQQRSVRLSDDDGVHHLGVQGGGFQ